MKRFCLLLPMLFVILFTPNTRAQNIAACDSVVNIYDSVATYKTGNSGLMQFVQTEIVPAIQSCEYVDISQFSSLKTLLTIDNTGHVIDAEFIRKDIPEACRLKIKTAFMNMDTWHPAYYQGRAVCSKVYFPIACLKWQ